MLSIIIPVFNSRETLKLTLDAVSCLKAITEVIVVENGSADLDQTDLAQEFGNLDLKLVQLKEPDLSTARNVGFSLSSGIYCWFLDSDDLIDPQVVEEALALMRTINPDVAYLGIRHQPFDSDPDRLNTPSAPSQHQLVLPPLASVVNPGWFLADTLTRNTYSPVTGAYIFCRRHLEAHAIRFHEGHFHEDHFFSGAAILASGGFLKTHRPGLIKVAHANSLSRSLDAGQSAKGYKTALRDLVAFAGTGSIGYLRILPFALLLTRIIAILVKLRMHPPDARNVLRH